MSDYCEFGKIRKILWPIHRSELKLFIYMFLVLFLVSFNYNLLRGPKDAFVITAPSSGAEAIPFIKVWGILPMSLLMTFIFSHLSNRFNYTKVFYIIVSFFVGFFLLFAFVLYPLRDVLHPNSFADKLQEFLPLGLKGLIALIRNWTFTLFYVMSEMWGTIVMTILFWGFANSVTSVKDAKRLYGILSLGCNLSGAFAGETCSFLTSNFLLSKLNFSQDSWGLSIIIFNCLVATVGLAAMFLFYKLNKNILKKESLSITPKAAPPVKMGIRENFSYLFKSKYLICIAVIVISYNICINLVEVVWKNQVKQLYPNPADFASYMGQIVSLIGIASSIMSVFVTGNIIRKFSWTTAALAAPFILLITGCLFFLFLLINKSQPISNFTYLVFGISPLAIGVFLGSLQNIFARASKYSLFDSTKELALVPLDYESKLKGKAAIDGIGSRLGKSGGSIIQQTLLLIFGTIGASTPFISLALLLIIGGWMFTVKSLGRKFEMLTATKGDIDIIKYEAKKQQNPATQIT